MYIALQVTRGWGFRREVDELNRLVAPHFIEMRATPERVRATLRRMGKPHKPSDVNDMIAQLAGPGGPRFKPRQGHYVQNMLGVAIEAIMPLLWLRTWRLLDFGKPMLLTSDEPVAILRSQDDTAGAVGIAQARAIWLPIDRQHALALTLRGTENIVPSKRTRANQINTIVASQAERWIFHHPDDNPLEGLKIGPRMTIADEVVSVIREGDIIRERHRLVRRPLPRNE